VKQTQNQDRTNDGFMQASEIVENTQGLINKDLLLDWDDNNEYR